MDVLTLITAETEVNIDLLSEDDLYNIHVS